MIDMLCGFQNACDKFDNMFSRFDTIPDHD